ncbi:MAG: hypothetical protein IT373_31910 [Polyangiaceae bacterium]|nr:hypothetical protein [Polyangiaceae bacterium]
MFEPLFALLGPLASAVVVAAVLGVVMVVVASDLLRKFLILRPLTPPRSRPLGPRSRPLGPRQWAVALVEDLVFQTRRRVEPILRELIG